MLLLPTWHSWPVSVPTSECSWTTSTYRNDSLRATLTARNLSTSPFPPNIVSSASLREGPLLLPVLLSCSPFRRRMFVARLIARGGKEEEGREWGFVDSNNSRAISLPHLTMHIDSEIVLKFISCNSELQLRVSSHKLLWWRKLLCII